MQIKKEEKTMIMNAFLALSVTILIIIFSEDAFYAALEGLRIWWEVVFPSLLPFFIIAEILMGLGVVHFLGALMEPLMRPLFKVPGVGAFAMAMGLASGYPIGAKITGNLRRNNLCSKTEGERLVSFTNTADPLFMIGAVAVGMFHKPELGLIIAGAHYISSIGLGLLMRFYRGNEGAKKINDNMKYKSNKKLFKNAITELITARKNDGRSFGELLGDSVRESINTLLLVGGFIILFSVITKIIIVTGLINIISTYLVNILSFLGLSHFSVLPLISGFFEITNGANIASQAKTSLLEKVIVTNIIIAWSGLSVHAQVAAMINGTDIKIKPYIFARIIQSILAGITTVFLFKFIGEKTLTTFLPFVPQVINIKKFIPSMLCMMIIILGIILILSIIIYYLKKIIFNH